MITKRSMLDYVLKTFLTHRPFVRRHHIPSFSRTTCTPLSKHCCLLLPKLCICSAEKSGGQMSPVMDLKLVMNLATFTCTRGPFRTGCPSQNRAQTALSQQKTLNSQRQILQSY